MHKRFTTAQVRAIERYLIEVLNIPAYELMCRAGQAAFERLEELWPDARRILVLCGSGNNGGDGYVLARLAQEAGLEARVAAITEVSKLKGDARRAHYECTQAGVDIHPFDPQDLATADLLVDAIFGTGLDRPVDLVTASQIEHINASTRPVLALDTPSGLHADTGTVMGAALRATATISFIGLKQGCFICDGPKFTGRMHFSDLGASLIPEQVIVTLTKNAKTSTPYTAAGDNSPS